nr:hypothetical protein Iba_chr01cCG10630 [Ipomoea batatas]
MTPTQTTKAVTDDRAITDRVDRQWKHRMKVETVVILLEYNVSSIEVFLGGNQVDKYDGFLELLIHSICSHDAYLASF